jgi:hypothetical protein
MRSRGTFSGHNFLGILDSAYRPHRTSRKQGRFCDGDLINEHVPVSTLARDAREGRNRSPKLEQISVIHHRCSFRVANTRLWRYAYIYTVLHQATCMVRCQTCMWGGAITCNSFVRPFDNYLLGSLVAKLGKKPLTPAPAEVTQTNKPLGYRALPMHILWAKRHSAS